MAELTKDSDQYGDWWYYDTATSKGYLSMTYQKVNVTYIHTYCAAVYPTWTVEAIAGMCGNFQSEGVMNPALWEVGYGQSKSRGYGIAQWTPATKLLDWLTEQGLSRLTLSGQLQRIYYEKEQGIQWYSTSDYPMSFEEFLTSTKNPEDLASAWLYNYERPKYPSQTESKRRSQALAWYEYITGEEPPTPPDPPPHPDKPIPIGGGKGLPVYMYPQFRKPY